MDRRCGECSVCCVIGAVPELNKPAHTPCKYIKNDTCGSCSIYHQSNLPKTCSDFQCSWRRGHGLEDDRPDKIGIMFSVNRVENQLYLVAIETEPDAIKTTGRQMAITLSRSISIPMIVVYHNSRPPNDVGDAIVIPDQILSKCKRIAGTLIERFDESVAMYQLMLSTRMFEYQRG